MAQRATEPHGNVATLASLLELSAQRIYELITKGVLHREPAGDFVLSRAIREYYEDKHAVKEDADLKREQALLAQVKRRKAEIELAKLEHRMHDAKDVEIIMTDMIVNARTRLEAIPYAMANVLEGKGHEEIFEILNTEIKNALTELAEYEPTMFDVEDDDETAPAVTAVRSKGTDAADAADVIA